MCPSYIDVMLLCLLYVHSLSTSTFYGVMPALAMKDKVLPNASVRLKCRLML
jgi:hypothetical protein